MKRKTLLLPSFFVLLLSLTLLFGVTAQAAQTIDLAFDGIRIPVSTSVGKLPAEDGIYPPFYLDVAAEKSNNRTFVPLRLVSELLGTEVEWQSPNVLLTYDETSVKLTIGSKQASKNQTTVKLDAAPYMKGDRTMVPIRFIAESFNCQVDYAKNLVNIKTAPLVIENKQVAKMTRTLRGLEYIDIYKLKANLFVKNMYQTIFNQHGPEVDEPEYYGVHVNLDPLVYYWNANDDYTLLDANDKVVGKFVIYVITGNGLPRPEDCPKYLLYDDLTKKWYVVPEATYGLMQRWNWTATRFGAAGYDTAWQFVKRIE